MTLETLLKNPIWVPSTTSTVALSYLFASESCLIPGDNYKLPKYNTDKYELSEQPVTQSYRFLEDGFTFVNKAEIIHEFASNLLKNSIDLDPAYARIVSEKFWDLI